MQKYNKDLIEVRYVVPELALDNEITSEDIADSKFKTIEKEIDESKMFNFVKKDRIITYGDRAIYHFNGSEKEFLKIQYNAVSQKFKIKIRSKETNFCNREKALDLVDRIQDIVLDETVNPELIMSKDKD